MKHRIVITHAESDQAVASAIRNAILENGMKCELNGAAKNQAKRAINDLEDFDAMVLVISAASNDSAQVKAQVEAAANSGLAMIPFRIDNTPLSKHLEYYLSTPHWLDASTKPLDRHFPELAFTLRRFLDYPRPSRKSKAAAIVSLLSLVIWVIGPIAIVLGIMELKLIRKGRASILGLKYAWFGIITASVGMASTAMLWGYLYYRGIDPEEFFQWLRK